MKKNKQPQGLKFTGSLRSAGITFYQKQGQTIMRSSTSYHQKSCTRAQFVQRQRMRHTMALWTTLKYCKTMFTGYANSFRGFSSLANRMPAVYVTDEEAKRSLAFLMPGIPVSEGTLPPVQQSLGEVNGVAALLTDLKLGNIKPSDAFWLYTAEQRRASRSWAPRQRSSTWRKTATSSEPRWTGSAFPCPRPIWPLPWKRPWKRPSSRTANW